MAYELTERIMRLRFRGTEFDGVEARATYPSAREYLEVRGNDERCVTAFGQHLLDWSITQNGDPVPATPEALDRIDADLALSLAINWLNRSTRVQSDTPLPAVPDLNGTEPEGTVFETL